MVYHQLDSELLSIIVDRLDECDGHAMSSAFALFFFSATPRLLEPRGIGSISTSTGSMGNKSDLMSQPYYGRPTNRTEGNMNIGRGSINFSMFRFCRPSDSPAFQVERKSFERITRVYGRFFFCFFFPGYRAPDTRKSSKFPPFPSFTASIC